jgi:hypothetical protein
MGAQHTPWSLHLTSVERARIFRLVLDKPQSEVAAVIEQLVEACKGAAIQLPKGLAGNRCTAAVAKATSGASPMAQIDYRAVCWPESPHFDKDTGSTS